MESLIDVGEGECTSVSADKASPGTRGQLVHAHGGSTRACASVADKKFKGAEVKKGCLRLSSNVEVYQWIESKSEEEREKFGGGKETITTYTYSKEWSSFKNNSDSFQESKHRNTFPPVELGSSVTNCQRVEYGEAFVLTDNLVGQCNKWKPANELLPTEVSSGSLVFRAYKDDYFYTRPGGKAAAPESVARDPEVGDTRVRFQYVPEGEATIMALQDDADNGGKETFLPYRLISRGCCGISEDQKKARLLEQGRRSQEDLAKAETVTAGPLWCLCLPCNLVAGCMAGFMKADIYDVYESDMSKDACFESIKMGNVATTWLLRIVGWVMMFAGLYSFFSPLITMLAVIPFIEYLGSMAIWGFCFIVTFAVSAIIISLAYLAYHPLKAMFWMLVAGLIIAAPQIIAIMSKG